MKGPFLKVAIILMVSSVLLVIDGMPVKVGIYDKVEGRGEMEESGPILIDGNGQLEKIAGKEGWIGRGLYHDPYVISGLQIDLQSCSRGVSIEDVNLYLEIRNCRIDGQNGVGHTRGLELKSCSNITIEKTVSKNCSEYGVYVSGSRLIIISDNSFVDNGCGLKVHGSHDMDIAGNQIHRNKQGMKVTDSDTLRLVGNTLSSNEDRGMTMMMSTGCDIYGNKFVKNLDVAIYSFESYLNRIFSNSFIHNMNTSEKYREDVNQVLEYYNLALGRNIWYDEKRRVGNHWRDWMVEMDEGNRFPYKIGGGYTEDPYPLKKSPFITHPSTPTSPSVEYLEEGVRLSWEPPTDNGLAGEGDVFYRVTRTCRQNASHGREYDPSYSDTLMERYLKSNWDYEFHIRSYNDYFGSLTCLEIPVRFDTDLPEITVNYPNNTIYTNSDNYTLEWEARDSESGISHMDLKVVDGEWEGIGDVRSYELRSLKEGLQLVLLRAVDIEENIREVEIRIVKDTLCPEIMQLWENPSDVLNGSSVRFGIWSEDESYGKVECEYNLDSTGWIPTKSGRITEVKDLDNGDHEIRFRSRDRAGNVATRKFGFIVDKVAPSIEIINPRSSNIYAKSSFEITWKYYEKESGVKLMEYSPDGEEWTSSYMETKACLKGLSEGRHTITMRIEDLAGNIGYDSVEFVVDTMEPEVVRCHPEKDPIRSDERIWVIFSEEMNRERTRIHISGVGGVSVWENGRLYFDPMVEMEEDRLYHMEVTGYDAGMSTLDFFSRDFIITSGNRGDCPVRGRVTDEYGRNQAGVRIFVNGSLLAVSDENGFFSLKTNRGYNDLHLVGEGGSGTHVEVHAEEGRTSHLGDIVLKPLEKGKTESDDEGHFAITILIVSGSVMILIVIISVSILALTRRSRDKGKQPGVDVDIEENVPSDVVEEETINIHGGPDITGMAGPSESGWPNNNTCESMYPDYERDIDYQGVNTWEPMIKPNGSKGDVEGVDISVLYDLEDLEIDGDYTWKEMANPLYEMDESMYNDLSEINCYEVLGISHEADKREIRAAYRSLAIKYHPDKISRFDPTLKRLADIRMKIVNYAKDTLTDPLERVEHDRRLGII